MKSLTKIEVEEGNKYFCADDQALYRILEDGTKELLFVYDTTVETYTTPKGVSSIASKAFELCDNLKALVLGEDIRTFNEYSLELSRKVQSKIP